MKCYLFLGIALAIVAGSSALECWTLDIIGGKGCTVRSFNHSHFTLHFTWGGDFLGYAIFKSQILTDPPGGDTCNKVGDHTFEGL